MMVEGPGLGFDSALLTDDTSPGILLPQESSVIRLDPATGLTQWAVPFAFAPTGGVRLGSVGGKAAVYVYAWDHTYPTSARLSRAAALDVASGATLWKDESLVLGELPVFDAGTDATGSLAVFGSCVNLPGQGCGPGVMALSVPAGEVRFNLSLPAFPAYYDWFVGLLEVVPNASLVVVGTEEGSGLLGGQLFALDARDGSTAWQVFNVTATNLLRAGETLVVGVDARPWLDAMGRLCMIRGYDVNRGSLLWEHRWNAHKESRSPCTSYQLRKACDVYCNSACGLVSVQRADQPAYTNDHFILDPKSGAVVDQPEPPKQEETCRTVRDGTLFSVSAGTLSAQPCDGGRNWSVALPAEASGAAGPWHRILVAKSGSSDVVVAGGHVNGESQHGHVTPPASAAAAVLDPPPPRHKEDDVTR
jgi:hypothetical protein